MKPRPTRLLSVTRIQDTHVLNNRRQCGGDNNHCTEHAVSAYRFLMSDGTESAALLCVHHSEDFATGELRDLLRSRP